MNIPKNGAATSANKTAHTQFFNGTEHRTETDWRQVGNFIMDAIGLVTMCGFFYAMLWIEPAVTELLINELGR